MRPRWDSRRLARSARRVLERLDILAAFSERPGELTRTFLSPAMKDAHDAMAGWLKQAGLDAFVDGIGNFHSVYRSAASSAKTLLIGSHLDTVIDAGKYDGALGVVLAVEIISRLAQRGESLPFHVEVIAFSDEEGVRYQTPFLGSRALAGALDDALLDRVDAAGVSMREAIYRFGGDPARLTQHARDPASLLGYLEVHIEQGPVLESLGLPLGVVSAIAGQSRFRVSFGGVAAHAGTTPMAARHDALAGAAAFVLAAEELARAQDGLVATVGELALHPGASNVIPGAVRLSLDVRHSDDGRRRAACETLRQQASTIAVSRGLTCQWELVQESATTPCSPELTALLAAAVEEAGLSVHHLPSMAGHDGVILAAITPISMLFVRCRDGISHSPLESVEAGDIAHAIDVVERFLRRAAHSMEVCTA